MLLIFDLDGTLVDTFEVFVQAFNSAARRFGFSPYDPANRRHIRSLRADEVLAFHHVPDDLIPSVMTHVRSEMEAHAKAVKPFPGVEKMLFALHRKGHALALVSSNSERFARSTMGLFDFDLWEEAVFDVPLMGKEATLRDLRTSGSGATCGCVAFGDEIRDCEAAARAGVPFVGVSWGYNSVASLHKAGCRQSLSKPYDLARLADIILSASAS